MELIKFRVTNFRSIKDSGEIAVDKITSLVGRNESGKSNLILALSTLKPPGTTTALSAIKDFPRGRRLEECKPDTPVVASWWKFSEGESAELARLLPGAPRLSEVEIGRGYDPALWIKIDAKEPVLDPKKMAAASRKLRPVLGPRIDSLEAPSKTNAESAWTAFDAATSEAPNIKAWAATLSAASADLRRQLGGVGIVLNDAEDEILADIEEQAGNVSGFEAAIERAKQLIWGWLPIFVYVSEFPELYGHQNLDIFTQRRGQDPSLIERENNFEKLARVADFDPARLNNIRNEHEERAQILNRAGSLVTAEIRRLWKDQSLMVRFNLDGPHLDILVSDPNAEYPVEVNLDERSRGFRWFFAFFITFSADTKGGNADGAILLLDEPGLYLHAKSQGDLLKHLREDYKNQIIYTTHSPFMVPADAIKIVRTVNIQPSSGTTVTNTPTGDSKTLFPLQAALGYHLSQTLFVGNYNLIIEGITDFWILSAVNAHFATGRLSTLPAELTLMPVGGAGKVSYMAALLAAEELKVLVLLDDDRAGRETRADLIKSKLIRETAISFVTEAFAAPAPAEADIEDLLDPSIYDGLVQATYASELKGKTLSLNPKIPRIVKRYEGAFAAVQLEFNKTRPAREFMSKMMSEPNSMLSPDSQIRFEMLFGLINEKFKKLKPRQ